MYIERKDLVEGTKYFMDEARDVTGVFKGRDEEEDAIYFDCEGSKKYYTSSRENRKGLVMFGLEGDGFEEVLIGDNLTEENIQLINSFNSKQ